MIEHLDKGQLTILPVKTSKEVFRSEVKNCRNCKRRDDCLAPVQPNGSFQSPVYFQGRDPGIKEDVNRVPFYHDAAAGRMFARYLRVLGAKRTQVYVTNTVFCHGKGDRPPDRDERLACFRLKRMELSIVQAKFFFLMGNDAYHSYFGSMGSVVRDQGRIFHIEGRYYIPIYHPGFAMRSKINKMKVLQTLQETRIVLRKIYKRDTARSIVEAVREHGDKKA